MKLSFTLFLLTFLFATNCSQKDSSYEVTFTDNRTEHKWALAELNPDLPSDWSDYNYLVLEMKASSPQRFKFGFFTESGLITKNIHPFPGAWIKMAVPLDFYSSENTTGSDMAATYNQPRATGWINIGGRVGSLTGIDTIYVRMEAPIGDPTLEIKSISLELDEVSEYALDNKPMVDKFGQWINDDWLGKIKSIDQLKQVWKAEDASLKSGETSKSKYGGDLNTQVEATGFFRIEKMDASLPAQQGKWWFVDPEGHLFLAAGVNVVSPGHGTRVDGREEIFAALPPKEIDSFSKDNNMSQKASFSIWNLYRRYGSGWRSKWKDMTVRRMDSWGLNAINWSDTSLNNKKAYTKFIGGWGIEEGIMGMPDVYSQEFKANADQMAAKQCAPLKDDPWLLGYFIGNEPPWPGRESLLVDEILKGQETATRIKLEDFLAEEDTPKRRKTFVFDTFKKFLEIVNRAVKKHDPNHLNMGIRYGGSPSDEVIKLASVFDVYSLNSYEYEVSQEYLDHIYKLTELPILIGEFHFGAPARGLSSGLSQVGDLHERGVAYSHYVENAFANSAVIGTFWFIWRDQPNTGRFDGENYNIGLVDVTDQPYPNMVNALKRSNSKLFDIHSGKVKPVNRLPKGRIYKKRYNQFGN